MQLISFIPLPIQKIVPVYVKTPILHCHFGEMASHNMEPKMKYVYILRKHSREIRKYGNGLENVMHKTIEKYFDLWIVTEASDSSICFYSRFFL